MFHVCAAMFALFVTEFRFYRTIDVQDRLSVNSTHGEHLKVSFDVVFPHIGSPQSFMRASFKSKLLCMCCVCFSVIWNLNVLALN